MRLNRKMRDQKVAVVDACVYIDRQPSDPEDFKLVVVDILHSANTNVLLPSDIPAHVKENPAYPTILRINVESGLEETECESAANSPHAENLSFNVHLAVLHAEPPDFDFLDDGSGQSSYDETVACAEIWQMPHETFLETWDSLIFDTRLKSELFSFVEASLLFARRGVPLRFRGNKIAFLHGPPGTGKTTLCHALAQKLSVYLSDTFETSYLIQVSDGRTLLLNAVPVEFK